MARIPIAKTVAQAISKPIGFAPNLVYARRELSSLREYGDLWQSRFVLVTVNEYAKGSWKTLKGAQERWEEGFSDGYVEVVPLKIGTFRAAVTYFKVIPRKDDPRSDEEVIAEKINAPPLPRTTAPQEGTNFGLFHQGDRNLGTGMEREDPDRPGYMIADEG